MRWLVAVLYLAPLVAAGQSKFNCPSDLGQQDDTREEFLKRHNNIRQNIALGMLPVNLFAYFLGPAKNMYKLEWSCDLERIAKATIDKCQFKNVSTKYVYSTNKFAHSGLGNVRAIEDGVYEWVNQIQMNDFGPKFQCHDKIREFCNMAYPTNTRVGCAYERCGSDLLFSCAYEEGKQVPFKPLLEVSARYCACKHYPNSNCDEDFMCTTKRNTTIEPLGPATIKTTTTTRATTTTTATPKLDVPKASCPHLKNVMTDKVRQVFLDTHNKWRSLVARGKAKDLLSPSGYAPKASQMTKLILEKVSTWYNLALAEHCEELPPEYTEESDFALPESFFVEDTPISAEEPTEEAAGVSTLQCEGRNPEVTNENECDANLEASYNSDDVQIILEKEIITDIQSSNLLKPRNQYDFEKKPRRRRKDDRNSSNSSNPPRRRLCSTHSWESSSLFEERLSPVNLRSGKHRRRSSSVAPPRAKEALVETNRSKRQKNLAH
ncbi:hypothetical protein Q1695_002343 [Nippostrongylus brasiliensis]|nr:hypothetical protein Q1695_002343 [Nippostrongylus brasiliensis]